MRTVMLDTGRGQRARFEVDETDHIGRIMASGHWYERDLLNDARQRVSGPGTAVDVGAHIGNHALWFALAMGLHVVALEPRLSTSLWLTENVTANGADVHVIAAAAGREKGWASIVPPRPGNSGTAAVRFDDGEVPVTTLDELALSDVRLLKVDVEGAALDVLAGAQRLLAEQSPIVYAEGDRDEIAAALPPGYSCFGQFAKTPTFGFARG